ncbi:MAG: TIGR04283 family arsenosugar biosynthesis glycosyltransferase [Magnetococcales bacterium]|nr:TIGR04283 family arsenosugar biosynthesis glycosyltransferase [Magnetococcales bacterium]
MSPYSLSIIVPVLNEAEALPRLLEDLHRQTGVSADICLVDGGSVDDTAAIARKGNGRLLASSPGRARQLNRGAETARSDFLLFLHADSRLPRHDLLEKAIACLVSAQRLAGHDRIAGHFPLLFDGIPGKGRPPRYWEVKTRSNRPGTIHGDQGLLLSTGFFRELGPFDQSLPYMEDEEMARRIARRGRWITLPGHLLTSSRRFQQEGLSGRMVLNALIQLAWQAGCPDFLHRAPDLYRAQGRNPKRALAPFFALFHHEVRQKSFLSFWYQAGSCLRQELWQPLLLLDLLLFRKVRPLLVVHDHLLAPALRILPLDGLFGVLAFLLFGLLWGTYRLLEASRP